MIVKHGIKFTGMPAWAAQQRDDEVWAMVAFLRRLPSLDGATMNEVASRLTDDAMREIAAYCEQLPLRGPETASDGAAAVRGGVLASTGRTDRDIPACVECHGPSQWPKNPAYPRLAGQSASYLRSQLMLLQERRRGGTQRVNLMHAFVDRLTAADIDDVTVFFAAQPSAAAPSPR